jgi:hypothetical protein
MCFSTQLFGTRSPITFYLLDYTSPATFFRSCHFREVLSASPCSFSVLFHSIVGAAALYNHSAANAYTHACSFNSTKLALIA